MSVLYTKKWSKVDLTGNVPITTYIKKEKGHEFKQSLHLYRGRSLKVAKLISKENTLNCLKLEFFWQKIHAIRRKTDLKRLKITIFSIRELCSLCDNQDIGLGFVCSHKNLVMKLYPRQSLLITEDVTFKLTWCYYNNTVETI